MFEQVSVEIGGRKLTFETGKMARQAHGAVVARYGDTVVLATACMDTKAAEKDFLPLTVDYREYTYSAGKIPGGFFKREGRPSEREILVSRLTDRPLRPLFPEGWSTETQIVAMVLSADSENDPDGAHINRELLFRVGREDESHGTHGHTNHKRREHSGHEIPPNHVAGAPCLGRLPLHRTRVPEAPASKVDKE